MSPRFARIAFLRDGVDPGWVGPPGPAQFSKAPAHDMLASANLNVPVVAEQSYVLGLDMARGAAGGLVAEVLPLSDAPPAPSHYGPVAPAWAQRHPRMIFAWAWLRALRWLLRDFWRSFIRW